MPTRYITSHHVGPGVQIVGGDPPPVGSGGFIISEDLRIEDGVLIARTDAFSPEHFTVYQQSLGSVELHGSIFGDGIALQMGDVISSFSGNLTVGATGHIESTDSAGVRFQGAARIENSGVITGHHGMQVGSVNGDLKFSTFIDNNGTISAQGGPVDLEGFGAAIQRNRGSQEVIRLVNEGVIQAQFGTVLSAAYSSATANTVSRDVIVNHGRIIGNIVLGHGNDVYDGRDGRIRGFVDGGTGGDVLRGGANAERLKGGAGADTLSGGGGADDFIFDSGDSRAPATGRDRILDFNRAQHDQMDLSRIDANTSVAGNQAFRFIGDQGFHGSAGELRYFRDSKGTHVLGDVNGDGRADFVLDLVGQITLTRSDFLL